MKATITYDVVTYESAENGEAAEGGWWMPGGWEYTLTDEDGEHPEVLQEARNGAFELSLRDAIEAARELGATQEIVIINDSLSARSVDPVSDRNYFEKGESRYYTLHIGGCSEGTLKRIKRVLTS